MFCASVRDLLLMPHHQILTPGLELRNLRTIFRTYGISRSANGRIFERPKSGGCSGAQAGQGV